MASVKNRNVKAEVTQKMIAMLEEGVVPWRQPWSTGHLHPRNLISGHRYRGINILLTALQPFESPFWLTAKQARENFDIYPRKGEKGTMIVFFNMVPNKKRANDDDPEFFPVWRYYIVFNSEQFDGIEEHVPEYSEVDLNPIEEGDKIISEYEDAPTFNWKAPTASYIRRTDTINIPVPPSFDSTEEYYHTTFHEMIHSTGHELRLDRDQPSFDKDDVKYAKEELVAEIGAGMLSSIAGIDMEVMDNSAAYIDHWIKVLSENSNIIVSAGSQAWRAVEHIVGENDDNE